MSSNIFAVQGSLTYCHSGLAVILNTKSRQDVAKKLLMMEFWLSLYVRAKHSISFTQSSVFHRIKRAFDPTDDFLMLRNEEISVLCVIKVKLHLTMFVFASPTVGASFELCSEVWWPESLLDQLIRQTVKMKIKIRSSL